MESHSTEIHHVEERPVTSPEDWQRVRVAAVDAAPRESCSAAPVEVAVLLMGQPKTADNGPWLVMPDGAHRRPEVAYLPEGVPVPLPTSHAAQVRASAPPFVPDHGTEAQRDGHPPEEFPDRPEPRMPRLAPRVAAACRHPMPLRAVTDDELAALRRYPLPGYGTPVSAPVERPPFANASEPRADATRPQGR
jgi:hypothetical protein